MLHADSRWLFRIVSGPALRATALIFTALLTACGPGTDAPADASPWQLSAFRVRADFDADLNTDAGWAGEENEVAVVDADEPFRLRVEVAPADAGPPPTEEPTQFTLEVSRNGGAWAEVVARDFPYPDEISSPTVSIVRAGAWSGPTPTADLLGGSALPFAPGDGVDHDSVTTAWTPSGAHGEWEWPLVIRRFSDGGEITETGDEFEFRMVDHKSGIVAGAMVSLRVPEGHLGGTFVETPGRIGPWASSDGTLYFTMEPAETDNLLMMVSSTNSGSTWSEVDGLNRPRTGDLEGFATAMHDGRIHVLHQADSVFYHSFRTPDDASGAAGWEARDELLSIPSDPPTQVAALEARPDGSLVAIYGDSLGLRMRIREADGEWTEERILAGPDGLHPTGPQTTVTRDGLVHIAYSAGDVAGEATRRSLWHQVLTMDGALSTPRMLAEGIGVAEEEAGALAPLVYLPGPGTVSVIYRRGDGQIRARRVPASGGEPGPEETLTERRVVQNAVDSDQVGMDAIGHGTAVHVLFIDEATRDLYHLSSDTPGQWSEAVPVIEGIEAQWVRGNRIQEPGGSWVYGFVYDAGSMGGSGMNRYGSLPLPPT